MGDSVFAQSSKNLKTVNKHHESDLKVENTIFISPKETTRQHKYF
jgi:hypothetical protein